MSSTPPTSGTGYDSQDTKSSPASTPPSSPPSAAMSERDIEPVSEAMLAEEKKMKEESRRREAKEKQKVQAEDEAEKEAKYKKLMKLVDSSKLFATLLTQQLAKKEVEHESKGEAEKKRIEKKEAKAEEAAVTSQRRTTRGAAAQTDVRNEAKSGQEESRATSNTLPTREKKNSATKNRSITDYMKKEDLQAKSGGRTVNEALAEAAEEHGATPVTIGAQNLRSANQPKAVTGGIMRQYQLEGLYWLSSLYENGLNGILADEMGLGKTIQTISFLAFLREKQTYGPFLVVAPLSTLSNWIEEFAKWTPSIPTVLYHGSPAERKELRSKRMSGKETSDQFPVVCTSYEICMNDRKYLTAHKWKYIIIDEGHRMKNKNCRLIKELKQYHNTNRLLITGTPLQNNITELWSLLNYLMPEIFSDIENFESMFDFSGIMSNTSDKEALVKERKSKFVVALHEILKPFLLRRVKTDVETDLPKKREYILYAPLTAPQKELYRQIVEGNSRAYLEQQAVDRIVKEAGVSLSRSSSLKRKVGNDIATLNKSAKSSRASTPGSTRSGSSGRKVAKRKSYKELSDTQYFKELEESSDSSEELEEEEQEELDRAKTIDLAKREIGNKKLQNPIMQLRLACNSPHNFYWPWANDQTPDSTLVTHSGKMLLLDRLVPYLFAQSHKILIFSQFKTQLDILEDWASLQHHWPVCRIDGAVPQASRRQQIAAFNTSPSVRLFLLSTRAGGQGINLTAADTVILFDSDWNPQQDLQAQDRAHRIGQTRPVIVYRLATKGTVEQTLLLKADGKRRLEKLVIQKGKFRSLLRRRADEEVEELASAWEGEGGEGFEPGEETEMMLSEEDLRVLTDRSDEAYERAAKGLDGGERFRAVETKREGGGLLAEVTK